MTNDWRLDTVTVPARTVYDSGPTGPVPLPAPYQPVAGATLQQWWAPEPGAQFLEAARAMAFASEETLQAVAAQPWLSATEPGGPVFYLQQLFGLVMEYFDCMNVPWYLHATSRLLYRKHVAGAPYQYAPNQVDPAMYKADPVSASSAGTGYCYGNFNPAFPSADTARGLASFDGGWYRPNRWSPEATRFTGLIPARARALFEQHYPRPYKAKNHPTAFNGWILLDLAPVTPSTDSHNKARAAYAPDARNVVVAGFALPSPVNSEQQVSVVLQNGVNTATGAAAPGRTAAGLPSVGWDDFFFDTAGTEPFGGNEIFGNESLSVTAPPRAYLAWAQEWITALQRLTPAEVLAETRAYTAYVNQRQADFAGGAAQFLSNAGMVDAQVILQRRTADPGLQTLSAGLAAVGAAVAPAGPVGFAAGLILEAAALTTSLVDKFATHNTSGIWYDDLGRPKPTLERLFLSGSPTTDVHAFPPTFAVPEPPATGGRSPYRMLMERYVGTIGAANAATTDGAGSRLGALYGAHVPALVGAAAGAGAGGTLAMVGLAALAAYGAWVAFRPAPRKSQVRRNPTRRRAR